MPNEKGTVLFVCQHGGAKSVIATSYFNRLAEQQALPYVAVAASAEDPYAAVPAPVAEFLQRDGVDVRSFKPRHVEADDVSGAARVVSIGCNLDAVDVDRASIERWDDVPQPSEGVDASAAAIRRHVEALAEDLRGRRPGALMIEIIEFDPQYRQAVTDLIVGIQRNEFTIDISAEEQPDLASIPSFYQTGKGNFWVAVDAGEVVGTIALKDIGNDETALRKMFVDSRYRGAEHGVASALLTTAINWSKQQGIRAIYLGTTEAFRAAHRFYEKNGFHGIDKSRLPPSFPVMRQDTRFYWLGFDSFDEEDLRGRR